MSNNIVFGKYIPVKSKIHQCHPLVKIICALLFILSNVFTDSIITIFFHIIVLGLIIYISKISGKYYFQSLTKMKYFLIALLFINIIFSGSVWQGLIVIIKMFIIIVASSVLLFTTSSSEMVYGLKLLFSPLQFFRISSTKIAFSLSLSLRFIPILLEQAFKILKSQMSRGLDYSCLNLKEKIKYFKSFLIPMFVLAMKRADILAEAMEVRMFNLYKPRSSIKAKKINIYEIIVIIMFIVEFIITIYSEVLL